MADHSYDKEDQKIDATFAVKEGKVVDEEGRSVEDQGFQHHKEKTHRGLKSRHISMIAIGGAVGTGLIIGSGTALPKAGPVGLLMGYSIIGCICFLVMISLGEMATYLPHRQGFAGYATRFVDPALGFALGWNYLFKYLIVTPNNIVAAVVAIQYWDAKKYNPAIYISVIIALIFLINLLGVKVFGEFEFWMSSIKVITLVGLIILGIVLDLGGGPDHDRKGFRYWKKPGPFGHYIYQNGVGVFLGVWYAFPNALFAYIGTELVGVTVGECANPRKQVPRAIRSTFYRILFFYIGGIFVVGLNVPSNSPQLLTANKAAANANASPFVVAVKLASIPALPSIINACVLLFVFSAANSDLYIGSRTLYALALEGQAPAIFKRVSSRGIPFPALVFCTAWCALAYTAVSSGSLVVFKYFVSLISMFGAITWMTIVYSHICFMRALEAQGISRDTLPYKAPFQPYGAWIALGCTGVVALFKGFDAFMPKFAYVSFITNYIAIPVFVVAYFGYKAIYKTTIVRAADIDLITGVREIDDDEAAYTAETDEKNVGQNWFVRWWKN